MATRRGDDAEGATIAAAVLHFQVGAGLRGVGREGEGGELGVGEGVVVEHLRCEGTDGDEVLVCSGRWRGGKLQSKARDHGLVAVADDGVDFGKSGEFLGGTLGITAGDDDARVRVLAVNAAEVCAGLAVGFGGDAAGIYNDNIG